MHIHTLALAYMYIAFRQNYRDSVADEITQLYQQVALSRSPHAPGTSVTKHPCYFGVESLITLSSSFNFVSVNAAAAEEIYICAKTFPSAPLNLSTPRVAHILARAPVFKRNAFPP